ncbi:hypothetical protein LguiA_026197 [Lonicera macranthoides]
MAIGSANPVKINPGSSKTRYKCLDWLDQQELRLVIYVSFRTTVSMIDEEIKELAMGGLERTKERGFDYKSFGNWIGFEGMGTPHGCGESVFS